MLFYMYDTSIVWQIITVVARKEEHFLLLILFSDYRLSKLSNIIKFSISSYVKVLLLQKTKNNYKIWWKQKKSKTFLG